MGTSCLLTEAKKAAACGLGVHVCFMLSLFFLLYHKDAFLKLVWAALSLELWEKIRYVVFTSLEKIYVVVEIHSKTCKPGLHEGKVKQDHLRKVAVRDEEYFLSIKHLCHWSFITVETRHCIVYQYHCSSIHFAHKLGLETY